MKYLAIAKITTPSLVLAYAAAMGINSVEQGSIFVTIPELGLEGGNYVYCRYGLSVPYVKVKVGDKLWVEPTIHSTERWIYSGFADCAQRWIPVDTEELILETATGQTIKIKSGKIYLAKAKASDPTEPLVLGTVLVALIDSIIAAIGTSPLGTVAAAPGNVTINPAITAALASAKSTYLDTAGTNILSQLSFTERNAS